MLAYIRKNFSKKQDTMTSQRSLIRALRNATPKYLPKTLTPVVG
jgi:hypothetical protein